MHIRSMRLSTLLLFNVGVAPGRSLWERTKGTRRATPNLYSTADDPTYSTDNDHVYSEILDSHFSRPRLPTPVQDSDATLMQDRYASRPRLPTPVQDSDATLMEDRYLYSTPGDHIRPMTSRRPYRHVDMSRHQMAAPSNPLDERSYAEQLRGKSRLMFGKLPPQTNALWRKHQPTARRQRCNKDNITMRRLGCL